jgi:2-polyprenyl-6-methoxyphenol hydroxylase-like FAD-dependent oxidoreductase
VTDQGQGGGMAVEDAAALGVLFSDLRSKEEISARLNLFQELRLERVSAMQILSSVGQDEHMKIADKLRPYFKGTPPSESHHPLQPIFSLLLVIIARPLASWPYSLRME